jgi:hypothetical protein
MVVTMAVALEVRIPIVEEEEKIRMMGREGFWL